MNLTQDLRYGFRMLWKNPVYALISVLTLALGIGASTAIFSVVYGVILRQLPYDKPDQIVRMWELDSKGRRAKFSDPNFEDLRAATRSLQGIAEMTSNEVSVSVDGAPDSLRVASVSKDFFSVMGVQPVMGRLFAPEEQTFGAAPAALVSYSYWQRHLREARDLGAVKFAVSKKPTAIVGVLPPGFSFPINSQVWMARESDARLPSRSAHNWHVVARLGNGVSLDQARAEGSTIARRIYQQNRSNDMSMEDVAIIPLKDALTAGVKPAMLVLSGVAGLLLLVACANVMNLSMAQASARAGELAVRVALGASRWRLARQFLAEAILLCLLGGFFGALAAYFGAPAMLAMAPSDIPRLGEISVNLPVLLFALGLSFVVSASLGAFTALRATSGDARSGLAEGGLRQGTAVHSQRIGRMIVTGQVAITLTLLVAAGLLGRSMLRVLSVDPGFETERVVTLNMKLPDFEARMETQRVQFFDQLISRLQTLPSVQAVGAIDALPLTSAQSSDGTFAILNAQQLQPAQLALIDRSAQAPSQEADAAYLNDLTKFFNEVFKDERRTGYADYIAASEGYFQTIGIRLLKGRLFNNADGPDAPHVALISESVAREKWPNQDPIGHTIEFGNMDGDLRLLKIVGVVADARMQSLEEAPRETVYVNYRQRPRKISEFNIVMRTNSDPAAIFAAARGILSRLDPTVPLRFNTFTQIYSESLNGRRFNLFLVGVFALAALMLAMAGVFGVLAYSVAQRTREIGVRIALGATTGDILKMVLAQGLITTVIGIAIGIVGALLLARTMRSLLFEVSPADPVSIVGVSLLLMLVAMLASYIPARRAIRVDPMVALRFE